MKSKSMLLVALLMTSYLLIFSTPEITLDDQQPVAESVASQWQMTDAPGIQSGWFPNTWQPDPNGPLWDLEFSPDASKVAAVEIFDNRLYVWNVSDGRVLLWIDHPAVMVDVTWLSNDWVLTADGNINWYSYRVVDDGSSKPQTSTEMRSGQWTDGLAGTYNGLLWSLDASVTHSKVAFCGNINHLNMGGEVVIADLAYFIDGSPANVQHFFPQYWSVDCAISTDGGMVAALGRNLTIHPDGNKTFRDVVYGIDTATGALQWERFVGGDNSSAWAVTWEPGGGSYTIAYNHPLPSQPNVWEGVATAYAEFDGSVFWYSPIPQNVSSLEWLPDGSYLGVGLFGPGRISFIDTAGQIQTDFGWHAVKSGANSVPADVLAVATATIQTPSTANQWMASAGRDGAIEIWTIDTTTFEILPYRRLGPTSIREIEVHPTLDLVAIADASGVVTVRSSNGSIERQCFHPEFGQIVYEIPYGKSVDWIGDDAVVGFSDGVIIACNEFSKWSWTFDLRDHKTVGAFGRIAMHQSSNYAAISWSSNTLNTSQDGHVAIIEPMSGQFLQEWQYSLSHWTLAFNDFGTILASVGQTGGVRLWNTSDVNPQNWADDGSPYSHSGYAGVTEWMPGADLLVTAGWDKQLIVWDVQSQAPMQQITLLNEAFSFTPLLNDGMIVVGTGDASNSLTGQLEFHDMQNNTLVNTFQMNHIPRGLGVFPSDQSLALVNHTGTFMVIKRDADGDGWDDTVDAFPNDPTQYEDSDGDGWGDDQTQPNGDACLNTQGTSYADRNGCPDSDGDGYSDADVTWLAHPAGQADAFPNMPSQWRDTDGDSHGDEYSFTVGTDGLRVGESGDAFINDSAQYRDLDGDGCGDNYTHGDDNGMRINEMGDAFISDPTQCNDFDGDGYGDNYTFILDSGGLRVEMGDAFPADYLAWSDLDGDGCPTNSATGLAIDLYPTDSENCDTELPFWLPLNLAVLISNDAWLWHLELTWDSAANNTDIIRLEMALTDNETTVPAEAEYVAIQVWTSLGSVSESLSIDPVEGKIRLHLRLIAIPEDGDSLSRNWTAIWVGEPADGNGELNINLNNLLIDGPYGNGYERHNQTILKGIHVEQCALPSSELVRLEIPTAVEKGQVVVCGALLVKIVEQDICWIESWDNGQGGQLAADSPDIVSTTPCPNNPSWAFNHTEFSERPMDANATVSRLDPGYPLGGAIAFPGSMCDTEELNEWSSTSGGSGLTPTHWRCVDVWQTRAAASDNTGDGNTSSTNPDDQSDGIAMIWYAVIVGMAGIVLVLLLIATRYNRKTESIAQGVHSRGGSSQFAPPTIPPTPEMHLPCKECGGFVQEVDHQGARWTWCPSCREWQDFLGKN